VKLLLDSAGARFDQAIARTFQASGESVSVREIRNALKSGQILVNERRVKPGSRAKGDETLQFVHFTPRNKQKIQPAPDLLAQLNVLYEDQRLLALDKPSGVHTLPQEHLESNTLLGAAVAHAPEIASFGPPLEGGALHRLDRGTSGVVLFAKDETVRDDLRVAFQTHAIEKEYFAIVFDPDETWSSSRTLTESLNPSTPVVRIDPEGLSAKTTVELVRRNEQAHCQLRAVTSTGRRHQIRLHLSHAGTPILGDDIYGDAESADRLALHASVLSLPSGLLIESPLPSALQSLLQ